MTSQWLTDFQRKLKETNNKVNLNTNNTLIVSDSTAPSKSEAFNLANKYIYVFLYESKAYEPEIMFAINKKGHYTFPIVGTTKNLPISNLSALGTFFTSSGLDLSDFNYNIVQNVDTFVNDRNFVTVLHVSHRINFVNSNYIDYKWVKFRELKNFMQYNDMLLERGIKDVIDSINLYKLW